uniref:ETAA1 activator of ATR kinase a n=1 Tax=Oncorhynchus kisutch TaxID=8019 RepID=A0A8C7GYV3_ONCKI
MTEWRTCDTPASGMTAGSDESKQGGGKPKTNRLRRSLKQTQATPSLIKPTRVTRSRYNNVFNKGESPMNESELQQDIVWDATSPSPLRTGKKYSANVGIVDISDIVNRIAPKVGNTLAKSCLLQWIGDSAIPCTPEMQQPRAKNKSPRTNGVDDLLKLAKQFDFNMFRQDEERVNDIHKQSLALWRTDSEIPPDHEMEDDLDVLFDGPTQHISLNLSQNSLPQSSKVIPGKYPYSIHGHTSTVSSSHPVKRCSANNNFDDDWENDYLLDDSLVFEMTQNPDPFAAPNHCLTQKGPNETKHENNNPSAIPKNALQGSRDIKQAVSKGQNETVKNRKTFTLEANPNVQSKSILSEALPKVGNVPDTVKPAPHRNVRQNQRGLFPINKAPSMESSYQLSHTLNFTNSYSMWPLQVENSSYHKPTENSNMKGTVFIKAPASHSVIPEDDLDSLFASDSIWDDKDDDLLCQACDHLESQVQSMEDPVITRSQFLPSNQTERQKFVPVSAPLNSSRYNVNQTTETTQSKYPNNSVYLQSAPCNGGTFTHSLNTNKVPVTVVSGCERPSYIASAGNAGTNSTSRPQNPAAGEGSYGSTRVKSTCVAGSTANQQGTGSEAAGKCSVVEIELKKQQAMERRRQRMQTAHNLRAPT